MAIKQSHTAGRASRSTASLGAPGTVLSELLAGSREAFVAMDVAGTITDWNSAAEQLFGFTCSQAVGRTLSELIVPPSMRAAHRAGLARFLTTGVARAIGQRMVLSALHREGHEIPVEFTISALRTTSGWAFYALVHDVSPQRSADRQAELLASIVENSHDAICSMDRAGVVISWNAAAERMFGYDEGDVVGCHVDRFASSRQAGQHKVILHTVLERGRTFQEDARYRHKDGRVVHVALTVSPVHDASGTVVGCTAVACDISDRVADERWLAEYAGELKSRTSEDPETGLRARSALRECVRQRIVDRTAFALLLLSVDGLPQRNARDGYEAGNHALRRLAQAASMSVRVSDEVFRFSDTALAVLLTTVTTGDADDAGSRIRGVLARAESELAITDVTVRWTVGVDVDELIHEAQQRLDTLREGRSVRLLAAPAPATLAEGSLAAVQQLLRPVAAHLDMDVTWLSEFTDDQQIFRAFGGDRDAFGLVHGTALDLDGSFCLRVLDGRLPAAITDTAANPVTAALPVTGQTGLGAYVGVPVRLADGQLYGMLCAGARNARPALAERHVEAMQLVAVLVAERLDEHARAAELRRGDLEDVGVVALLAALDGRDHYTGEHSQAVVHLSGAVARHIRLSADMVEQVERIALVHDIGKVGIPDSILHKQGPLNELEWDLMRQHSALGASIVASIGSLAHLAPAVRAEHERWDGHGYPDGLIGDEIPIASRIILTADAYHAMTSDRPYRAAMTREQAIAELRACTGTQFDPKVAEALIEVLTARENEG